MLTADEIGDALRLVAALDRGGSMQPDDADADRWRQLIQAQRAWLQLDSDVVPQ